MSQMVRPLLRQTATELNDEEISNVGGGLMDSTTDMYSRPAGGDVWTYEGSKAD